MEIWIIVQTKIYDFPELIWKIPTDKRRGNKCPIKLRKISNSNLCETLKWPFCVLKEDEKLKKAQIKMKSGKPALIRHHQLPVHLQFNKYVLDHYRYNGKGYWNFWDMKDANLRPKMALSWYENFNLCLGRLRIPPDVSNPCFICTTKQSTS